MSSKPRRRRPKSSSVPTKQAFEENEDETKAHPEETPDQPLSSNASASKEQAKQDRLYEKTFFTIKDLTVEVILDENILSWSTVSDRTSIEAVQPIKSTNINDSNSVDLHNVFAVSPIHQQFDWSLTNNEPTSTMTIANVSSTESQLRGFKLHTYNRMEENILQEICVIFRSVLPESLDRWYQLLSKLISEYKPARNILVICNPFAGSRSSRHVYNVKIRPSLERAHHNITYSEINEKCSADEALNDFHGDFASIHGLVIVGGDGSVINVINALLRYLEKENQTKLNAENDLPSIPFPIAIVPTGTTNIICHSIYGNTEHCTPVIHLLLNQRMKIDMSAVFDVNYNFLTANFSAGAGYPANVLKYFKRYSFLSSKKIIQKSFAKATSNKNLKPIEMEIRYVPADHNAVTNTRCYQGCPSCTPPAIEQSDNRVKVFDEAHLQKMKKRKKPHSSENDNVRPPSSLTTLSNKRNEVEKTWKVLRQNYLQVAVFTNANLWSFAPQGLSKFGHLADGLLDLVLIEPTSRKDFLRYLKRNGNSKNQYEFAFTSLIKVKEIEIELKLPIDNLTDGIFNVDNQLNSSSSDDLSNDEHSDNENKFSLKQKHEPHPPSGPISEDSRRHRRRHHHLNEQTEESSRNIDPSILQNKKRNEQHKSVDYGLENAQMDMYNSNTSLARKTFFQSLKSKKEKVPLPRPSSASGSEHFAAKQHRRNQQFTDETRRPARSLFNRLLSGNTSSGKQDSSSLNTNNNNSRRASMFSRSSSVENVKTLTLGTHQSRNKKQPCMWNLDFTPYDSPLIRMKCFYRFLPVFGVGLNPDTMIKEVNYSCFGRIG